MATRAATGLETWELLLQKTSHFTNSFFGVTAGESRVVVVDGRGLILSWPAEDSTDRRLFQAGFPLRSVAYGNGEFVAVGLTNRIVHSSDGVNWEITVLPEIHGLDEVVFGNGTFLAEAANVLLRSTNGVDWSPEESPALIAWPRIFFAGDYFILPQSSFTNRLYLSREGVDWSGAIEMEWANIYSLGFIRGRYVALSIYEHVFTSPDAVIWRHEADFEGIQRPMSMASGNGYLVTGGGRQEGGGAVGWSRDGVHWTVRLVEGNVTDLAFVDGRFIALQFGRNEANQPISSVWQSGPAVNVEMSQAGVMVISGARNHGYRIESSHELGSNEAWAVRHSFTLQDETTYTWSDPRPGPKMGFYRVTVVE